MGAKYYGSILGAIGDTPLFKLEIEREGLLYPLFAKAEFMNPSGSIKDRIAGFMIERAEAKGLIGPGSVIVEATSGNTGISLSMVAAVKGYKMVVVMPEHMSQERIKIMEHLGASVCLTPKEEGFEGAIFKTHIMAERDSRVFLPQQFENEDNTLAHYTTTGAEIIEQIEGKIDAFVDGVGTGGTLMGVGALLREIYGDVKIVAVEPAEAAILSGEKEFCEHKIAGIGDGFIPALLRTDLVDEVVAIRSDDAIEMAKLLSSRFGLMVGISSGANVLASLKVLEEYGLDKTVVTVLPDRAERYFSTELYIHQGMEGLIRQCSKDCECVYL